MRCAIEKVVNWLARSPPQEIRPSGLLSLCSMDFESILVRR